MTQPIRRDALLALLLFAFSSVILIFGSDLSKGRIDHMGAGYVPWLVGLGLLGLGTLIAARAVHKLRQQSRRRNTDNLDAPPVHWRGVVSISLAAIAFAVLVRPTGLAVATIVMVLICMQAQIHSTWLERALVAGFLAIFAVLVFPVGLGLPIPIIP